METVVQLAMWSDADEDPPSRSGYFIIWRAGGGPRKQADTGWFDGYRKWYKHNPDHVPDHVPLKAINVEYWMELPDKPSATNIYPDSSKNVTLNAAAEDLYSALRRYQMVAALTQ